MAKEVVWYEVFEMDSISSNRTYFLEDFEEKDNSLIGRYSTKSNAIARLKKWADQKGINFEENVHVEFDPYLSKIGYGDLVCVGTYYALDHIQVKYTDDWAFAKQAVVIPKIIWLDKDI